ncbi:MAG: hypothetical protein DWQ07_01470 [Chloroflexi bacterium]|nr:MAG: hypothetical protein DWQ07_01470 [Chloroflexota bacterium]MBL1193834.1 hypothetical protein [Chloroflexota bacterium]NOH11128.1 PQQ-binding-like beta-propeller repeat protein [Chloroflexota bacterium]
MVAIRRVLGEDIDIRKLAKLALVVLCAKLLLAACVRPEAEETARTIPDVQIEWEEVDRDHIQVIVDTDMGADDITAILFLLEHPGVEVLAITVTGTGLVHCEPGLRNAYHLLALTENPEIPVACGAEAPLRGDHAFPDSYRALADAFYDMEADVISVVEDGRSATGLLAAVIENSPDVIHLLTLGPLTNIAALVQEQPHLMDKLAGITMMGGAIHVPGNIASEGVPIDNQVAEWNFYADPFAARVVFESGIPLTLVPLDATNQVPLEKSFFEQLQHNQESPAAVFTYELLEENNYMLNGGWYFWDTLAAVIFSGEDVADLETTTLCLIDDEGPESGRTQPCEDGASVQVPVVVDPTIFEASILSVLNGVPISMLSAPDATTEIPLGNLLWKYEFGKADHDVFQFYFFPPRILDKIIYFPVSGRFHAVDGQSGELMWEFDPDGDVQAHWTVNQDAIFIGSTDGYLYALDRLTGEVKWRVQINEAEETHESPNWIMPNAAVDSVFVGSRSGELFAFASDSGEEQWRFETAGRTDYTPIPISDTAFLGSSLDENLYALDAETGAELWRFKHDKAFLFPKIYAEKVYVSGAKIYALDLVTGEELWHFGIEGIGFGNMLLYEDVLLINNSSGGFLYALDRDTGQEVWSREFLSCVPFEPQATGNMFLLANEEGVLHALDMRTGQTLWDFEADDRICTAVTMDENLIYAGSSDASLYALERDTGELAWQYQTGGVIFSQPLVVARIVYFWSIDGYLYAVSGPQ